MLIATIKRHTLELPGRRLSLFANRSLFDSRSPIAGLMVSNNRANTFARLVYFLNAAVLLGGLAYITVSQGKGEYRCKSVTVSFNEEIWEHAHVFVPGDGSKIEDRLLIYSHFSGTYKGESLPEYSQRHSILCNPSH